MYGGGYSGYGGLSSSYGGLGSTTGMGSFNRGYGDYGRNNLDNSNTINSQGPKENPEDNHRKTLFEEIFKMMGGLRSIVELGFAAIAIANFYSHTSEMAKKLFQFLKSTTANIFSFLHSKITAKLVANLTEPSKRIKTLKAIIMNFIRVVAVMLLCLAAKMRTDIKKDSESKLQKLEKEYEQFKKNQLQLVEQNNGDLSLDPEIAQTYANL